MARRLPAVLFSLATLLLGTSSWSMAAISFIKTINATSSTTTGTSLTITVPALGVAAGNRAIVTIALNPSTGTVACGDTGGNSYAVDSNVANGSATTGVRTVILSAQVTTALVSGNTITCTHPSVTARALSAHEFSGLATSATVDKVATATGNNTAPSSGATTTTVQASELLVGGIGVEGPTTETFTAGASYTIIGRAGTSGGTAANNITINPEYRIVSATGAFSASGTLSASRRWATPIVTYKAAATAIPTKLSITSINSGANPTAGSGFPVVVQTQDPGGIPRNVINATGISLTLRTGTGALGGTLTGTIAAGTNQVTISGVTYTKVESGVVITATRTSGDTLTAGDSAAFTVVTGAATQLAFTTQPGNTSAGSSLLGPPTVTVRDPQGNTVTSSNASITVAIGTNPGGGTLSGTTTKNAVSGIANFSDLSINQPGNAYTLSATSSGLTAASSANFSIIGTTGTIGGAVSQSGSGAAIAGALVEVLQASVLKGSVTTAANGSYSISILAPGSYDVRASAAGYGTQTQNGQSVVAGTTTTVNFSLGSGPSISSISPSSGSIAALVTISGSNFGATQGSSAVSFNGIVAIPNSWSNNSIIVPIPTGASTGSVVVTVGGFASNTVNFSVQASAAISYVYDELGRLRAVTDPNSDTAVYNYDAVGNLLTISRQSSGLVSIIEFSPTSGSVGTNVGISGTGFSTTPSQNTVAFNGLTAAVVSATATKIVVSVPSGATTGPISVTTPSGLLTSAKIFTVGNQARPTIAGFTPAIGAIGTPVTITGTNFAATPSANILRFNLTPGSASAATSTSLSTSVPTFTGSGRISVATLLGTAVSSSYIFIAPPPFTSAAVESTGTITSGSGTTISLTTASKIALRAFEGVAGQIVSLSAGNATFGCNGASMYILKPDGTQLGAANICSSGFIEPVTLPMTGTYTVMLTSNGGARGEATLTFNSVVDATGTITADGAPVIASITAPGQRVLLAFSGTANQVVSLQATNVTFGCTAATMYIRKADGTQLGAANICTSGFIEPVTLPVSGTYTVVLDGNSNSVGQLTLKLFTVVETTGTITADGAPVIASITTPGQRVLLAFSGTANQVVSLQATNATFVCTAATMYIRKADGTQLGAANICTSGFIEPVTLPVSGTYTVVLDGNSNSVGQLTLKLFTVVETTGTITADGAPVIASITAPGQRVLLAFSGTANQVVSLQATNVTFGCTAATMYIRKADGTQLGAANICTSGFIEPVTLPVSGTYTVVLDGNSNSVGQLTLKLFTVVETTGTITADGAPVIASITTPGQRVLLAFSGTANQVVSLQATNATFVCTAATMYIRKADGTQLGAANICGGGTISSTTLPVLGTYTVLLDGNSNSTGQVTLRLITH